MLRTTNKRIIDAAMNLIIQKGYRAATTKEIAEKAKVSEATIFRNFKNKQGLMKAMIEQQTPVSESMITKAEGDLYEDLLHFAATLLQQLEQKKEVFRICLREPELFEDVLQDIVVYPQSVKKHLIVYFKELTKKNMISPGSEEANADVFMTMIFGYFIHRLQLGKRVITLSEETMLKHSTEIFMKGITGRSFSGSKEDEGWVQRKNGR
ncbi:TetR/AcrR family transcriptional regulator [Bacillus velezensis]|nr:TetR/AcrR family transcriptional regulator [Bacillus velezensis]QDF50247.1 TetR/AcrR family transcriptional regulator [Bacillus velezensis]QDF53893.1 TetR/AcrR family transcriptional regulator [Bacillus velezensis]